MVRLIVGRCVAVGLLWAACVAPVRAHVDGHPSIHDTVAEVKERFKRELSQSELVSLNVERVEKLLTARERHILGTEHLSFRVNVPAVVSVIRDVGFGQQPYWLKEREFKPTELRVQIEKYPFDVWQKEFAAGRVGLGVNSLSGGLRHYFVAIRPKNAGDKLEITDIYPGQHRLGVVKAGEKIYTDRDTVIKTAPAELEGQVLLRTMYQKRE